MITKEQLRIELDSLEDVQALTQIYQLIQQLKSHHTCEISNPSEQQLAMNDFFGMHQDLGIQSVEQELRKIRQGRWGEFRDL